MASNDNLDWIIRERLTTQKRIEIAKLQIEDSRKLQDVTHHEKDRIEKEIYLDIYPASKLDPYVHRLIDYAGRVNAANEEIKFHKKYLGWLAQQKKLEIAKQKQEALLNSNYFPVELKSYISPVNGAITQINKENFEVALESEIVMSVHKPTNLYIQAFYDQQDVEHLREGDLVDVTFPDGTLSEGIVQRFYAATYQLPLEFQKRYEPVTRSIAAEITPINELEANRWQAFYKLNAKVSKPLYEFLEYNPD